MERAAEGVQGATVERREGYLAVRIDLTHVPEGLSERTRDLVEAFPEAGGSRVVAVDVRNRQWAAMVLELLAALRR